MRAVCLAIAMLASTPAVAQTTGGMAFEIRPKLEIDVKTLTAACFVAAASGGVDPRSDPRLLVEWCARGAGHLISLYPRERPPGRERGQPPTQQQPPVEE